MTEALTEDLPALLVESEGDLLDELTEELRPRLQQALEQEDASWEHIQQLYRDREKKHDSKRDRLVDMLRMLGYEDKKKKSKAKTTKSGIKDPMPSRDSVEKLVRWLATQDKALNYNEITNGLGIAMSSSNKQVQVAREMELVKLDHMGGETGRMMYFSVWDGAIERLDSGDVTWPQ